MVHLGKAEIKEAEEIPPSPKNPTTSTEIQPCQTLPVPPKLRISKQGSKPVAENVPGSLLGSDPAPLLHSPAPLHRQNQSVSQQQRRGMVTMTTQLLWWLKGLPGEILTPPTGPSFGRVGELTISPHLWNKGFYNSGDAMFPQAPEKAWQALQEASSPK